MPLVLYLICFLAGTAALLFEAIWFRQVGVSFDNTAGTSTHSKQYMKMFVYLPVAVHPAPKKSLLISYGEINPSFPDSIWLLPQSAAGPTRHA